MGLQKLDTTEQLSTHTVLGGDRDIYIPPTPSAQLFKDAFSSKYEDAYGGNCIECSKGDSHRKIKIYFHCSKSMCKL